VLAPGHAPGAPDLRAPIETADPASLVLGVSGLNGSALAAQLALDAQLVGQLAFKEHESESLTAELATCQDLLLAIYGLARSFRSTIDLDVTLSVIAREATRLLRGVMGLIVIDVADHAPVAVTEPPGTSVDLAVARETMRRATGESRALVVTDAARALGVPYHGQALIAPIPIDGQASGALAVVGRGAFQAPDVKLAHAIAEQASVQIENALLHRRRVEQVRLENEMQVAARVQADLLPHTWPDVSGLDLAATTRPASHVCGDFYDVVPVAGGQLVTTLGDVSGKGVPDEHGNAGAVEKRRAGQVDDQPVDALLRQRRQGVAAGGHGGRIEAAVQGDDRSTRVEPGRSWEGGGASTGHASDDQPGCAGNRRY
jgi:phosphoserine phosphatase RsbU/P